MLLVWPLDCVANCMIQGTYILDSGNRLTIPVLKYTFKKRGQGLMRKIEEGTSSKASANS